MAEANRFLQEVFLPEHNARFAGARPRSRGRPSFPGPAPASPISSRSRRSVPSATNDNTVRYKRLALQIPEDRHRHHYVKAKCQGHEYHDGQLAIFHVRQGAWLVRRNPRRQANRKETSKQAA